jgi:hypothetical protein
MYSNQKIYSKILLTLTAQAMFTHAVDLSLNLRIAGQANYLKVENIKDQAFPFLASNSATYTCNAIEVNANPAFTAAAEDPAPENRAKTTKGNVDVSQYSQFSVGLKGIMTQEHTIPSDTMSYGMTASINGTYEASALASQASLYETKPLTSAYADIGLLSTINGNTFEIGGGANLIRYEFATGEVFNALGFMTVPEETDPNTTVFIKADKSQYITKMDYVVAPYLYAEFSTHLGDTTTIFLKGTLGREFNPEFKSETEIADSEMFPSSQATYEAEHNWSLSSINLGAQTTLISH